MTEDFRLIGFGRTESHRYSLASTDNTHIPQGGYDVSTVDSANFNAPPRPRHDSNALLMLPAPLSVTRSVVSSTTSVGVSRSSEDNYLSDTGSNSNQRLILPTSPDYADSYESHQQLLLPGSPYEPAATPPRAYGPHSRRAPSPQQPYAPPPDPFRSLTTSPTEDHQSSTYASHESEDHSRSIRGGVRLTDDGPVPGRDGVRRVSRQGGRRPTSVVASPQNRYSRSSTVFSLPPGAAPPQSNQGGL